MSVAAALAAASLATTSAQAPAPPSKDAPLVVQLTSPLGRTGMAGPVRIVARVTDDPRATLSLVQFFVDGTLVGQTKDGPPYAVEWADENPFESSEITVQVADSLGRQSKDVVDLAPLEVSLTSDVSSVLLEPGVFDAAGHPVNGLTVANFHVTEDGVPQVLDLAVPDTIPAIYTLLVDSSQSMSRRMDVVREAAAELPLHLRPSDQIVVVPFTKTLGSVTGPTKDRATIAGAIGAIRSGGGTAILDCLSQAATALNKIDGRHILVLITDGYDENSSVSYAKALEEVKDTQTTVYVIGVGGVAGMSLQGEDLLRGLATQTGGRAFFPAREFQLNDVHDLIAADVQERYVLSYTPTNQKLDGSWRAIKITTTDPTDVVKVREGYLAPSPPPVEPEIELTFRDTNHEYIDVTRSDLVVTEDGVAQKVEGFEEALAPVSIMLLLDSSGSMHKDADEVIAAARTFVGALPAKDRLAVMTFADKPVLAHDLTTNRDWSTEAIGRYQANGGTALYDALWDSLERLKTADGRRAIVVLTDGRDENNPGTAPGSVHTLPQVLTGVKDVGATVFAIGLGTKVDQPTLGALADASAGEAYFPTDVSSLGAQYRRILENLRRRYVIRYTSTNNTHDGTWRKVDIRTTLPGVTVESQGGYFAPNK